MKVLILLLLTLFLPLGASCEVNVEKVVDGLDLSALEKVVGDDLDVRDLILSIASGEAGLDVETAYARAREIFLKAWREMYAVLPALMLPALVSAVVRRTLGGRRSAAAAQYLCYLACALTQTAMLTGLLKEMQALAGRISGLTDAAFPLLVGLLSSSGATTAAAMLTPMAALLGRVIVLLLAGAGVKMCSLATAVAVAGNINQNLSLKNLFGLIVSVVNWALGFVMTGFVSLLSVQGLLGGGYDSASVRAARYAVDNLLPVIGGEVADTMDAVISSVLLVKNATGVTGMLALIAVCAGPLMRFATATLAMKLSAAVLEPLAEDGLTRLTEQIAKVLQMLLTIATACVVLTLLLLGAVLVAGRGVVR